MSELGPAQQGRESVTDDFDPYQDTEDPFANAVLDVVPMGTLREVLGPERANPVLADMETWHIGRRCSTAADILAIMHSTQIEMPVIILNSLK